ncbi:MAG: RDD family protein, partial [Planctomycetales bacterium]|nr:RDD family protein [Planctomycetales bacterium]
CTTPGKYFAGLTIRDFDGGRCSFRQTIVRTLFRVIEVNPILLGGIPAAASILWSRDKQRFGDKVARTVVVPR